jgi:hypothetical protein
MEEIKPVTPAASPPKKLKIISYSDLMKADLPDPEWFIEGMIPNPGLVAFTARPGSYKTFFVQWLSMRIAAGKSLFDKFDLEVNKSFLKPPKTPVKVLFIEEEMNKIQLKKRSNDMRYWGSDNFTWSITANFNLQKASDVKELAEYCRSEAIKFVVFDPFTSVAKMTNENDNAEAAAVMDTIRHELIDSDLACTVLFIHHPAKGEGMDESIRGAGDILGKCDMHFLIDRKEKSRKITIKCKKTRYLEPDDFICEFRESEDMGRLEWVFVNSLESETNNEDKMAEKRILLEFTLKNELGKKDLMILTGFPERRLNKIMEKLEKDKKIFKFNRYTWKLGTNAPYISLD